MGSLDPNVRSLLDDIHALLTAALLAEEETFDHLIGEITDGDQDPYQLVTALTAYVVGLLKVLSARTGEPVDVLYQRYLKRFVDMDAGGDA